MKEINLNRQTGAALIVSLVMLVILTMIAVVMMESSVVQERMAGNNFDKNVTFQAAETALRAGEAEIAAMINLPEPTANFVQGSVARLNGGQPSGWWNANAAWWRANGTVYLPDPNDDRVLLANTNENPVYIIEYYDEVCDDLSNPTINSCKIIYRVTAFAWGGRNATVVLQSLYARR